jgi:hypothetical protein
MHHNSVVPVVAAHGCFQVLFVLTSHGIPFKDIIEILDRWQHLQSGGALKIHLGAVGSLLALHRLIAQGQIHPKDGGGVRPPCQSQPPILPWALTQSPPTKGRQSHRPRWFLIGGGK